MSTSPFKVRSPGAVVGLSVVTLGIYGWVWYYRVNRELRDFGRARGNEELASSRPVRSLLAVTLGGLIWIPSLVSFVRTVGRLQQAEWIGSVERRGTAALEIMFVVSVGLSFVGFFLGLVATMLSTVAWLVGVALLQARLNAVWRCDPLLVEAPGERRSVAPAR